MVLKPNKIYVLDGALGTLLDETLTSNNLWSAYALANHPEKIRNVHQQYFAAGADIGTTSSYQASTRGFIEAGVSSNKLQAKELMQKSVTLAREARTREDQLVAGSVGPFGAFMATGQEYTGEYGPENSSRENLYAFHKDRLDALSGADLLAIETIPNFQELKVLMEMVETQPCWVTLSIKDPKTMADGTPIAEAVKVIESNKNVIAMGANCCALDITSDVLECFRSLTDLPLIVYPNSGEIWDGKTNTWHQAPSSSTLAIKAPSWISLGAKIIGGCCRTTPEDIQQLSSVCNRSS